jgi:hypothetical protein
MWLIDLLFRILILSLVDAFGDQGAFLKNRPLDPQKIFDGLRQGAW